MTFSMEKDLRSMADTVTGWESESRYGKGVLTTIATINECLNVQTESGWLTEIVLMNMR